MEASATAAIATSTDVPASLAIVHFDCVTPWRNTIRVDIQIGKEYDLTVRDLKYKIVEQDKNFHVDRIRLMRKDRQLIDEEILQSLDLSQKEEVLIVCCMKPNQFTPVHIGYDEFLRSVHPKNNSYDVPVNTTVCLSFGPNRDDVCLYTPALIDTNCLVPASDGDMESYFAGNKEEAARLGFRKWTDRTYQHRAMVIKVRPNLDMHVDSIKYNVNELNDGYTNGDFHSWQRYTESDPVSCRMSTTYFENERDNSVTLLPEEPLSYNTHYAILLMNNVPLVPLKMMDAPLNAFFNEATSDDKLFFFKTERAPTPS